MNNVLRIVDKIANADATVLIRGESGTGKELVARALHERSDRKRHAFVAVNCAAIPSELLECVLFGHERGAFTGAATAKPGKFAAADGGTIFLDEIGEMSPMLQSKLLRVLQTGEVDVVGRDQPRQVDLFYRLNVIPLPIPALRDRTEDIPVLLRHFTRKHGRADLEVDLEVDEALTRYHWPGNIRELENFVSRMLLLSEGPRLVESDLPDELRPESLLGDALPFELPADAFDLIDHEKRIIIATLQKFDGNQSAAARYLRIPRHVLLYRLDKYGIET